MEVEHKHDTASQFLYRPERHHVSAHELNWDVNRRLNKPTISDLRERAAQ